MNLLRGYFRELSQDAPAAWNRFWFTPTDPATLGIIRILAGLMLLYTHLVWTLDLPGFLGPRGWLTPSTIGSFPEHSPYQWSYFYWISSSPLLWTVHIAALVVLALFTIGFRTRITSILAFIATVSYINRASLAQFGLDDTNAMLALYLMIGPSGAAYSLDRWLKRRRTGTDLPVEPSIGANIAIRLLQLHMCVIYLFSGIGKIQGEMWWNGDAVLMAAANLEYQSIPLTWLVRYPFLVYMFTHITVFWEASYCVLVWPRLTRPIVLAIAVGVHLGIGMFLGMWTFGLAMIIGNLAFVSPWVIRRLIDRHPIAADAAGRRSNQRDDGTELVGAKPSRAGEKRQAKSAARSR